MLNTILILEVDNSFFLESLLLHNNKSDFKIDEN